MCSRYFLLISLVKQKTRKQPTFLNIFYIENSYFVNTYILLFLYILSPNEFQCALVLVVLPMYFLVKLQILLSFFVWLKSSASEASKARKCVIAVTP